MTDNTPMISKKGGELVAPDEFEAMRIKRVADAMNRKAAGQYVRNQDGTITLGEKTFRWRGEPQFGIVDNIGITTDGIHERIREMESARSPVDRMTRLTRTLQVVNNAIIDLWHDLGDAWDY